MSEQLQQAFAELLAEAQNIESRLLKADPPLDESELVEGHRWIFSLLGMALDAQVWADSARPRFVDAVGPYRKWGGDNADAFYQYVALDPNLTYRVKVWPGDAAYLSFTVYGGPDDGRNSDRIVGTANDRTMTRAADGGFELWLSPDPQPGNWLKLEPDAVVGLTRDYLNDPVRGRRAVWSIEAINPPPKAKDDAATLARRFRAARTWLREQSMICPVRMPPNTIQPPYPVPRKTVGWAAGDAAYAMGGFELEEDQVLVIEGRSPECAFWNLCLWNPFLHIYDAAYDRVTINGAQVVYEPDGSWKLYVGAQDPGHPNWISTQGHRRGLLWFRWFLPQGEVSQPTTKVIPRSAGQ